MPRHKEQNLFRFNSDNTVNSDNPGKKKNLNYSQSSNMDDKCDVSTLSSLLENASQSEEGIRVVTSVILKNPIIKNAVSMELTSELDKVRSEIRHLQNQLDDLAQYSLKNCLPFSEIKECSGGQENTDKIVLNICNKVILKSSGITLESSAIDNSHPLGPKP
jgi:hypothetical protein